MTIKDENMDLFIVFGKLMLKIGLAWLGTMAVFEQVLDQDVLNALLEFLPSQVFLILGSMYMLFIVAKKGVDFWEHWRKARYRVNEEKEKSERAKLRTDNYKKGIK